jgi:hypothetical protein
VQPGVQVHPTLQQPTTPTAAPREGRSVSCSGPVAIVVRALPRPWLARYLEWTWLDAPASPTEPTRGQRRRPRSRSIDQDQFQTVVTEGPGFVRITVSGPGSITRLRQLLRRIVAESASRRISRVLVDGRALPAPISTADKYDIGVAAGDALRGKVKLAVLGAPANIDHFFETVARNRGADVMAFTDESAAVDWLTGAKSGTPAA